MAFTFLHNFINKFKRRTTQASVIRKRQHLSSKEYTEGRENRGLFPKLPFDIKILFRPFLILLILAILYFIVFNVYALIQFDTVPYGESKRDHTENKWNSDTKLTVLMIGSDQTDKDHIFIDGLAIYSINPVENKLAIFVINPDLLIFQPSVGVEINYRSIMNNKKVNGDKMEMLINSVESLLALKIDRYVMVDKAKLSSFSQYLNPVKVDLKQSVKDNDTVNLPSGKYISWDKGLQTILPVNFIEFVASDNNGRDDQLNRQQQLIEQVTFNLFSFRTLFNFSELLEEIKNDVYTDISKNELFLLVGKISQIKSGDIKKGYTRSNSYSKVNSTSFYKTYTPSLDKIDQDLNNIFSDLRIFKEQAQIEILNASSVKGLANNRARWVANIGARVIKVGNSFESGQKITKIYCSTPKKFTHTIDELSRIFNGKAELVEKEYPNRHLGDIVVELGDKYQ